MAALLQIGWSFLPGLLWLWWIYRRDTYEPEPGKALARAWGAGMLAVIPAALLNGVGTAVFPVQQATPVSAALGSMVVIGPVEEGVKFAALWLAAVRFADFDETVDGLVYSGAVALGFASLENLLYIQEHGWQVIHLRTFTAVPGHFLFIAPIGFALGMRHAPPEVPRPSLFWAFVAAAALHGIYDAGLFVTQANPKLGLTLLLPLGVLVGGAVLYFHYLRVLRRHSAFRPDAPGRRFSVPGQG